MNYKITPREKGAATVKVTEKKITSSFTFMTKMAAMQAARKKLSMVSMDGQRQILNFFQIPIGRKKPAALMNPSPQKGKGGNKP